MRVVPFVQGVSGAVRRLAGGFAFDEHDPDAVRSEKNAVFFVVTSCCLAGLVWSVTYYLVFGWRLVTALPLAFIALAALALIVAHRTRRHLIAVRCQLASIILMPTAAQWLIGGLFDSGLVLTWAFLGPMGALFFLPFRRAVPWFLLYLACVALTVAFDDYFASNALPVTAGVPALFFWMNFSVSSLIVFMFAAYLVSAAATQRRRADDLLANTLPPKVVRTLKSGAATIADHRESATVLFADIVGSTTLFAGLAPQQVVDWLNEVFSAFDEVIARHGAEKIRTIGDNYMVAAGVTDDSDDHAPLVATVALEMLSSFPAVSTRHGRTMAFRLGMNSGPLVAGVIGTARLQYDLWGDTVNTAARMEAHGVPGRIHISEASYRLLKDDFECERRGVMPIKGKGEMTTWFLIGHRRVSGSSAAAVSAGGVTSPT